MDGANRTIDFSPSQMHVGKDTGAIGKVMVPNPTDAGYGTFLEGIVARVNNKMFAESEAQLKTRETVETYQAEIAFAESPEEFTEISERLAKESPAIRAQLKSVLTARLKETGISYNKAEKRYEANA
jgi:hypothetical protein